MTDRPILTTERVLIFARECFDRIIQELLDDPAYLSHDYELDGGLSPRAAIAEYRRLASDLGIDFDVLVARGQPFEIDRLKAMEQRDEQGGELG